MRVHVEKRFKNSCSGRRLYRQFKQQGLREISLELLAIPVTDYKTLRESLMLDKLEALAREIGVMTQEELERWRRSLESAVAEGIFSPVLPKSWWQDVNLE